MIAPSGRSNWTDATDGSHVGTTTIEPSALGETCDPDLANDAIQFSIDQTTTRDDVDHLGEGVRVSLREGTP